ncbi:unnamed protein product [Rhodiola kirilowii]
MRRRTPSGNRLAEYGSRSRISVVVLAMLATLSAIYVAGRLWQDAQNRVYLIKELDRRTGQARAAISVADSLKIITCREQLNRYSAVKAELAAAEKEGFVAKFSSDGNGAESKKKALAVVGIFTGFGRRKNRDAIRKAWMPTGSALDKLKDDKGIVIRFVIGRSSNQGDSLDRDIASENRDTNDFIVLNDHIEVPEELPSKSKLFFIHALDKWDADFYVKLNDDVFLNIDALGATLAANLDKPRAYMGCMKSGEVFSDATNKWYEPEWWKFGDKKTYFRHASGEIYVITRALAQYISINRSILRTYAHDDVSAGSWFIGLDLKYISERKFCCSSWSPGAICATV